MVQIEAKKTENMFRLRKNGGGPITHLEERIKNVISFFSIMYIFNPLQLKAFGNPEVTGDGFSFSYKPHKRFGGLWKSMFIPFGPIAETKQGFENFLLYIKNTRYNKVALPLPLILDTNIRSYVTERLEQNGFIKRPYAAFEDETLLTIKGQFSLSRKTRYKVRKCYKHCDVTMYKNPEKDIVKQAYASYTESANRIGFAPKPFSVFDALSKDSLVGIAYSKSTKKIVGFIWGYSFEINVTGFLKGKDKVTIVQILFSGTSKQGRDLLAGYGLRDSLIQESFTTHNADIVDSVGASRKWGESYLSFKKEFASKFVKLPGNYQRVRYIRRLF